MIIALEDAKYKLSSFDAQIDELAAALRIDDLKKETEELEKQTLEPDFWNDQANSSKVLKHTKHIKSKIENFENLKNKLSDAQVLCEMAIEENDESMVDEITSETTAVEKEIERQRIEVLLSGEYDSNNAILSFHPGAGGTEAQDWAQMLYRMYVRWGERHGFNVKLVDWLDGEEAGLKSATIIVEGENAYGYLKSENGVHRLVRVSPFDSSGRRHTSFASVEVMPEFDDDGNIEIREEDLEITAHRSSGAGGQHINKTDSAIRIVHIPTGIVVGCQTERSQLQNKEAAFRVLKAKLYELEERKRAEEIDALRGERMENSFGSQIRNYVLYPYQLVKDLRSGVETSNVDAVLGGDLDELVIGYHKWRVSQ